MMTSPLLSLKRACGSGTLLWLWCSGFVRWTYATSMENIREGLDRLEKFLKGE